MAGSGDNQKFRGSQVGKARRLHPSKTRHVPPGQRAVNRSLIGKRVKAATPAKQTEAIAAEAKGAAERFEAPGKIQGEEAVTGRARKNHRGRRLLSKGQSRW